MVCQRCSNENPNGSKICHYCSYELISTCPNCGFEYHLEAKFCSQCGIALASVTNDLLQRVTSEAHRRQLTIMFCDLVGSTFLSEKLDPEDYRQVILDYHRIAGETVGEMGGHIAQYLGDGLLIYFGYPIGLEEAPVIGVRCGLRLLNAIERANVNRHQEKKHLLSIRVGIHTGMVVIDKNMALGNTTNIAARLQNLAEPDTIVISSSTLALVRGWFETRSLGKPELKGIMDPMEVFQVLRETGARTRFEVTANYGLTPLIGRDAELRSLVETWRQVSLGHGAAILVNGEAGIGKSRLIESLKSTVRSDTGSLIELNASPYHQNSAFYPINNLFKTELKLPIEKDQVATGTGKLNDLFDRYLGLYYQQQGCEPADLPSEVCKSKIIEALVKALLKRKKPVLIILEDLHWTDPSTLEWLNQLVRQISNRPCMVVCTSRPGFNASWTTLSYSKVLNLKRFKPELTEAICLQQSKGKHIPFEILAQIVEKSDGIPLFAEEITKMVIESGLIGHRKRDAGSAAKLEPLAIPATLQDSLLLRLDMLAPAKQIAQIAAVIGTDFSYKMIRSVTDLKEEDLQRELTRLVDSDLILQKGVIPESIYSFKHSLIRDAAYQSMLKSGRHHLHKKVAQVLLADPNPTQSEIIANHLTEAGLLEEAVNKWYQAGQEAIGRFANQEAVNHLEKGIDVLKKVPESAKRTALEIQLLMTLGGLYTSTRSFAAPEVERCFNRAWELSHPIGDCAQMFYTKCGLFAYYLTKAKFIKAMEISDQLMHWASQNQDSVYSFIAHAYRGNLMFFLANYELSKDHYDQALGLYHPDYHDNLPMLGHGNLKVQILSCYSLILLFSGYAEQSHKMALEARQLAKQHKDSVSIHYSFTFSSFYYHFVNKPKLMLQAVEVSLKLAHDKRESFWIAVGNRGKGEALAAMGQPRGLTLITKAINAIQASGLNNWQTLFLGCLAEKQIAFGRYRSAQKSILAALDKMRSTGEMIFAPEIYRVRGKLMLVLGEEKKAKKCFERAIKIAGQQGAKLFELRAVLSWAEICIRSGKPGPARDRLQDIYKEFSEGFDLPDLVEAKKLLDQWPLAPDKRQLVVGNIGK